MSTRGRFHAIEGWYFQREKDGSVTIEATNVHDGEPLEFVTLDPATWASVVASMSARGEDAQTFGWAETLHAGGHLIRASHTPGPDPMPGGPLPDPFAGGDDAQPA